MFKFLLLLNSEPFTQFLAFEYLYIFFCQNVPLFLFLIATAEESIPRTMMRPPLYHYVFDILRMMYCIRFKHVW